MWTPWRRAVELHDLLSNQLGSIMATMLTNQCLQIWCIKLLNTQALHALDFHEITPSGTTWSVLNCVYTCKKWWLSVIRSLAGNIYPRTTTHLSASLRGPHSQQLARRELSNTTYHRGGEWDGGMWQKSCVVPAMFIHHTHTCTDLQFYNNYIIRYTWCMHMHSSYMLLLHVSYIYRYVPPAAAVILLPPSGCTWSWVLDITCTQLATSITNDSSSLSPHTALPSFILW